MTDLITQDEEGVLDLIARPEDPQAVKDLAKSFNIFPNLKLYSGGTDAVKNELITINHYGFNPEKGKITSLGKQVVIMPLAWRYIATRFTAKPDGKFAFESFYDPTSPDWVEIRAQSDSKEEAVRKNKSAGFDYLVWVPSQKRLMRFGLTSKTARNLHPKLDPYLGKFILLDSKNITANGQTWRASTAALYEGEPLELPPASLKTDIVEFKNAKYDTSIHNEEDEEGTTEVPEVQNRG